MNMQRMLHFVPVCAMLLAASTQVHAQECSVRLQYLGFVSAKSPAPKVLPLAVAPVVKSVDPNRLNVPIGGSVPEPDESKMTADQLFRRRATQAIGRSDLPGFVKLMESDQERGNTYIRQPYVISWAMKPESMPIARWILARDPEAFRRLTAQQRRETSYSTLEYWRGNLGKRGAAGPGEEHAAGFGVRGLDPPDDRFRTH